MVQQFVLLRLSFAKRLYWRRLVAIIGGLYGVVAAADFAINEFGSRWAIKTYRLGDHLPHLAGWTWAAIGLALALLLAFEGAYEIVQDTEVELVALGTLLQPTQALPTTDLS